MLNRSTPNWLRNPRIILSNKCISTWIHPMITKQLWHLYWSLLEKRLVAISIFTIKEFHDTDDMFVSYSFICVWSCMWFQSMAPRASSCIQNMLIYIAEKIKTVDAFVIVTCEYNHCLPPGLLNLINHYPPTAFAKRPSSTVCYSPG